MEILLTFDDGPTQWLPHILSILKEEKVQALFFLQSNRINSERILNTVLDHGHIIGSHGHSHRILTKLSFEEQLYEIQKSKEILECAIGVPIKWFRPPHGLYYEDTMKVLQTLNLEMVLWRITSWDWKHPNDEGCILENVHDYVGYGEVVLLHELPQTVRILPTLISLVRQKGLAFSAPYTVLNLEYNLTKDRE